MENTMSKQRSVLTFLSAACFALIVLLPPAEARQLCKPMVWGYGLHKNQNIAKIHALGAWTAKAKSQYGAAFGAYAKAKAKSQPCRPEGPGPNATMNCVVKGRPCATVRGPSDKEGS
jgi:hypothetical protein